MRLNDLRPTCNSFMYLERYLNDGSPSGFSIINTPTPGFRALDSINSFEIPIFDCSEFDAVSVGNSHTLAAKLLPVHPDMTDAFEAIVGKTSFRKLKAMPTSSGRTLLVFSDNGSFYAKVAYQGLLGRVTRRMTKAHVLSAIEVSSVYESAIAAGKMPRSFHIYREHCGLHFLDSGPLENWGYVERAIAPYPEGNHIEIPAFSLIAKNIEGKHLFRDLLEVSPSLCTIDGFFTLIIQPLLDLYFSSLITLGLQPECHAQNVVFLLDCKYIPIGVALRDMESVDKDLPLIEERNLDKEFTPTQYKFLSRKSYNYQIMHSFMYDFKLGEYLIGPLVDAWAKLNGISQLKNIEQQIRIYAREKLLLLPNDFFPEDCWYDYEAVVHEGSSTRNYRRNPSPRFR